MKWFNATLAKAIKTSSSSVFFKEAMFRDV